GVMVADEGGRVVYANEAYTALAGGAEELRTVERLFAGDAKAAEAIYRVAQAGREGRRAEEEVRLPAPLPGGEGEGARWYRIRISPVAATDGGRPLSAWAVADVTGERVQQETVFLELQHAIDYLDHAPA